jgi:para-nitrobenzyl esterase
MKRRRFLQMSFGIGAASAGIGAAEAIPAAAADSVGEVRAMNDDYVRNQWVTAETAYGKVRGIDIGGIKQFRGLPYGASTGGKHRFLPPRDPAPWTGTRVAYGYGDVCPQAFSDPQHPFGLLIDFDLHVAAMSEDCLNLNIWTPGLNDGAKRPVVVYFHGGGLSSGTGNHSLYVGERLARYADLVVITVNHRLSAFGYVNLVDLGAPAEFAAAGVLGLLDLIKALEWVRDNVAQFGGDPGRVTVFGQSGGGSKVKSLMAMPRARGLFHRAVSQSGTPLTISRERSAALTARLLATLGITKSRPLDLQAVPFEKLVDAQLEMGVYAGITNPTVSVADPPVFNAVIDGNQLPAALDDPRSLTLSCNVPFIDGYCLHDAGWPMQNFDLDEAGLRELVSRNWGSKHSGAILQAYLGAYPNSSPFLLQAAMLTDYKLLTHISTFAQRRLDAGASHSFVYRFDWLSTAAGGVFGAVHGMDMSLIFHNTHQPTVGGDTPQSRLMADKVAAFFAAFAATGNPSTPLIGTWPEYSLPLRTTMVINSPYQRAIADPSASFRALWAGIGAPSAS